jgi:hypothetical protein
MVVKSSLPTTLHAEQEHAGLRAVVVAAMLVAYILSFLLFNSLIRLLPDSIASFAFLLSCITAVPAAIGATWLLETWLKRTWHSGYSLTLTAESITVKQPDAGDVVFDMTANFSTLAWYFKLAGYQRGGRERRVQKEWFCFCCQVEQDGSRLIVYAFVPPQKTAAITLGSRLRFQQIFPVDVYDAGYKGRLAPPVRPGKIPTQVLSGKNGRYWLAEQNRWAEGLELTREDFAVFLDYLQTHYE